jgi:hypothetical protein
VTGRDERGRFLKGGDGGPGRKPLEVKADIVRALNSEITETDAVKLLAACVKRKEGWALKLWFAYLWGEPIQRVEASGPDGERLTFGIQPIDYRTGLDAIAPRPVSDSDTSG